MTEAGADAEAGYDEHAVRIEPAGASAAGVPGVLNGLRHSRSREDRVISNSVCTMAEMNLGDVDAWTYGVGGEYEFTGTPFSVAAGYTRADIESIDVDTWSLGVRYSFGGGLQARDRAGAGLNVSSIASVLGGL